MLVVDAVILMGGRASRLDGAAKGDLRIGGSTLLERALDAAAGCRARVLVGEAGASRVPVDVLVVREEPPFGGPAAAVAAGVAALPSDGDAVLLLAGDLPFVADAIPVLLDAFPASTDGVRAADAAGRAQHLTAIVRRAALVTAVTELGDPSGAPVRRLLAPLRLDDVTIADAALRDVDTWEDARAVGAVREGSGS